MALTKVKGVYVEPLFQGSHDSSVQNVDFPFMAQNALLGLLKKRTSCLKKKCFESVLNVCISVLNVKFVLL
jgi:hypothetical protein